MRLTVAVCTYRRFDLLRRCIVSLQQQTLSVNELCLLVIDNSLEPDKSEEMRLSLPDVTNLKYHITERCGIGFARNEALRLCETDLLAFIDDDCIASPDWAANMLAAVDRQTDAVGVIGGRVLLEWEGVRPVWLDDRCLASLGILDWGDEEQFLRHESGKWLLTANVVYRTEALRAAGGFPEYLGRKRNLPFAHEEFAANDAISSLGFDLVYSPHFVVKHFVPLQRARQVVLCRNAFWDGVSQVLWRVGMLTSDDVDLLAQQLLPIQEQISHDFGDVATAEQLGEKMQEFRCKGWNAAVQALEITTVPPYPSSRKPVMFIVTPSLNASRTIDKTILSVVSQMGDFSIRYHIQDGGSTDGTLQCLEQWRRRLVSAEFPVVCRHIVFTYCSHPDRGLYAAIRVGFASMSIPQDAYMTWINADDILMQNSFATVLGASRDIGDSGNWIGQSPSIINMKGEMIAFASVPYPREIIAAGVCDGELWPFVQQEGTFWRKALWDKVGGLNPDLKWAGDWDLWRRFAQHTDLIQVPWVLAVFRKRQGQLSSQTGGLCYRDELDSVVFPESRRETLIRIGGRQNEALKYPLLGVDYNSERYSIVWKSVRDHLPPQAFAFFSDNPSNALHELGNNTLDEALESAVTRHTLEGKDNSERAPERTVIGSNRFRRLYSASPAWVQRGFRVMKYSGVLRFIDAVRPWRMARTIRRSGLFLFSYYLERHPEVVNSGLDPVKHYLQHGFTPKYDPNPLFDSAWYASMNPELQAMGINPLYHYIRVGAKQGKDPSPHFSTADYCARHPDLDVTKYNPLLHYLCVGLLESDLEAVFLR